MKLKKIGVFPDDVENVEIFFDGESKVFLAFDVTKKLRKSQSGKSWVVSTTNKFKQLIDFSGVEEKLGVMGN